MQIPDYKMQAAAEAQKLINLGQIIGLGNGASVEYLARMIAADHDLKSTLTLTSSSAKTMELLLELGLDVRSPATIDSIDIYFDGCDQFDQHLNALKSGGGIHTTEKILASMSDEFILIGDISKMATHLDATYPLVVEILPPALSAIMKTLGLLFQDAELSLRNTNEQDSLFKTEYGNYLLEIKFAVFPDPSSINTLIKMIPGVIDHSLFYRMADKAIVAGREGVMVMQAKNAFIT